jgi:hypothetical protein
LNTPKQTCHFAALHLPSLRKPAHAGHFSPWKVSLLMNAPAMFGIRFGGTNQRSFGLRLAALTVTFQV